MKLHSPNALVIVLLVFGLVIPTGAVIHEDEMWAEQGLVLTPHEGPNGEYAEITEGNLSVDLATIGVNPNALTSVRNVFELNNHGQEPLRVWITHNATDVVTFKVDGVGPIQGETNNIMIPPGESRVVSLSINTEGDAPTGTPVLEEFQIHAATVDVETTDTIPSEGAGDGGSTGVLTPDSSFTATHTLTADDVEVIFDEPTEGEARIQELSVESLLGGEGEEDDAREPRAVITIIRGDTGSTSSPSDVIDSEGRPVIAVNDEVALSGVRSRVGSLRSIDHKRRVLRPVEITVPDHLEDTPARIRIRVDKTQFTGTHYPKIGRETEDGWQLLPTTVEEDGEHVIIEAQTRRFSRFAVFQAPQVDYTWHHDNASVDSTEYRPQFAEPGIHNVTLTVTDAFGRTNSASRQVVANDQPSVTIESPANLRVGEPLTFRANVTNEVGNATVTWTFPDGSTQTGSIAQHTFERGEHVVQVTVEDEYGASTTVERTVRVGPVTATELVMDRIAKAAFLELMIGLLALFSLVVGLPKQKVPLRSKLGGLTQRNPVTLFERVDLHGASLQTVEVESPAIDMENRQFVIGQLHVEVPEGDLQIIEITVADSLGNEVARKQIDLRGRSTYVSRNHVVIPKSRVYVRADEDYTFRVRARNSSSEWTGRRLSLNSQDVPAST